MAKVDEQTVLRALAGVRDEEEAAISSASA